MTKKSNLNRPILPVNRRLVETLLGRPPLLTTESPVRYWELFDQFAAAIEPKNVIEWLWLKDIVDLSWEIARLRRYKALWIEIQRDFANAKIEDARERPDDPGLFPGYPMTPEKIEQRRKWLLMNTEKDSALFLHENLESYETFEKLLKSAELRRDRILRELDARRERIGPLLRKKSDEIIDASAEAVPLAPE